jgi:MoaA/NifB/PqqE/SkfB family radical SAM enzyme
MGKRNLAVTMIVNQVCNFNCDYCFDQSNKSRYPNNGVNESILPFLDRLSEVVDINNFWVTGGEPFLAHNMGSILAYLTNRGVTCGINTNGSLGLEARLIDVNYENVIVNLALHLKELSLKGRESVWLDNYFFLKEKLGERINIVCVAYPGLSDEEKGILEDFYISKGVKFRYSAFIGDYKGRSYPVEYSDKDIDKFSLDREELEGYRNTGVSKGVSCYAGMLAIAIDSGGDIYPCSDLLCQKKNKMGNISDESFELYPKIIKCPSMSCGCPLYQTLGD